ncbi:AMIN domain-containing protein [Desulfofustis glycolicus]|uniref:AMIN domain-containing protein n=1 Tax=Desulfofustis glycolicus DSM 9705 TaxID=1121409 RepID=A0A1M5VRA8_9BACT|nr:AMIN domain-containing protein [Desulfofustis glycolicus]MCB2216769.1 AMIN domain-containing protein [Desulfobulbaceae bacterium]SHH77782.1 AMIN domain-containing protein [Desulfofustis glycolicus DSM 9705]
MKRLAVALLGIWFVTFGGFAAAEQPATEAVIESISYEKDDENREKIVFKLNGAHIPKVFKIQGERPRVVFDFIDTRYSDLINRIADTQGKLIKGVRIGIHDDPPKTRVVVDLKAEEEYQFEQDFLIEDNILSITFYPSETSGASIPPAPEPESAKAAVPAQSPELQAQVKQPESETLSIPATDQPSPAAVEPEASRQTPPAESPPPPVDDLAALLPGVEPQPEKSVDPILRDVSFDNTSSDSEMVLFKLNDFYPPIVFGIEKGNPRVVCDFLDTELSRDVRSVLETNGEFVARIRVARHNDPDKVRVVLDLVPNRNYDLQQVFFKEENLFVIVIDEFEDEPAETPPPVDVQAVR